MEWKGHPMHGPRKNPRYFHAVSLLCYGLGLFGVAALALGAWKNTNLGEQKHVDNVVHMRHYGALPCEPSVPKQLKVAIVGLVKGHEDFAMYASLQKRNRLLRKNLPDTLVHYDSMIFHEGDLSRHHQRQLASEAPGIIFRNISELWQSGKDLHDRVCSRVSCNTDKPVGYKLMCRFYGIQLHQLLANEGYDYLMRLDDDGFIKSPLPLNIFELMEAKGFVYGYRRINWGLHEVADQTLIPTTLQYIQSKKVNLACDPTDITTQHFYNNLFVTKLSFWTRPDVQDYLKYIDESGGIWRYSWGDSLIMALAVKMFARSQDIVQLVGADYEHASHHLRIEPTNADWRFRKELDQIPFSWYLCSSRIVDLKFVEGVRHLGEGCEFSATPVMVPHNALCPRGRIYDTCSLDLTKNNEVAASLCSRDNMLTEEEVETMKYCAALPAKRTESSAATTFPASGIIHATVSDPVTDPRLQRLRRSAEAHGISLEILHGIKSHTKLGHGGSGGKVGILLDFFSRVPAEQIVLVTDGFDVIYTGSSQQIYDRYLEMGGGVIFAAESNFHMTDVYTTPQDRESLQAEYNRVTKDVQSPFKYLQAGMMIGPAGKLKKYYEKAKEFASSGAHQWQGKSEQSLLSAYFAMRGHKDPSIQLDVCHRLFSTTFRQRSDISVVDGKTVHRITASSPLLVHAPGPETAQFALDQLLAVMVGTETR